MVGRGWGSLLEYGGAAQTARLLTCANAHRLALP